MAPIRNDRPAADKTQTALPPIVVFKIGGSLLRCSDLRDRIERVLRLRPGSRPVLLCGGGVIVDVVRDWGRQHCLTDQICHDLAMRSLGVTAALMHSLLPDVELCVTADEVEAAWLHGRRPVIQPDEWFRNPPVAGTDTYSESWDLTSDSLAGHIAWQLRATELVLCKSRDLPEPLDFDAAADAGLVDRCFPRVARELARVGWANLRRDDFAIIDWRCRDSVDA